MEKTGTPDAAPGKARPPAQDGTAGRDRRHILSASIRLSVGHAAQRLPAVADRLWLFYALDRLTERFPFIEKIFADGSYAGPIAQSNSPRPFEIIKRSDDAKDFVVLPKRWVVERTFAWLGINRRLAKDFERFAKTAVTFIQTAMIKLMTRRLARYVEF